jgi:hypothetical protein
MPGPSHVVVDPDPDMQMAHDRNDDDDDVDVDVYINTAYCDDLNDLEEGPSDKRQTITKRLSFHSQETPPDAVWMEPQREKPENFTSPKTLQKLVEKQNAITPKKKERKRKNKKETVSQPQPVKKPIRAQDGPARPKGLNHIVHTMGATMLNDSNAQGLQCGYAEST